MASRSNFAISVLLLLYECNVGEQYFSTDVLYLLGLLCFARSTLITLASNVFFMEKFLGLVELLESPFLLKFFCVSFLYVVDVLG